MEWVEWWSTHPRDCAAENHHPLHSLDFFPSSLNSRPRSGSNRNIVPRIKYLPLLVSCLGFSSPSLPLLCALRLGLLILSTCMGNQPLHPLIHIPTPHPMRLSLSLLFLCVCVSRCTCMCAYRGRRTILAIMPQVLSIMPRFSTHLQLHFPEPWHCRWFESGSPRTHGDLLVSTS